MTDAIAGLGWFVVNATAVSAAWCLGRRALPSDNLAQTAMHTLVILGSAIVGVCLLLGAAGALSAGAMGALTFALSAAVYCDGARPPAVAFRGKKRVLPVAADEAMAVPAHRQAALNRGGLWNLLHVLWCALASFAGGMVIHRLLRFPENWDDLMYHLPFVNHWLQDNSIYRPATSQWSNACSAEFIGLWLVAPFTGDFWIGAANLPVVTLLALSVFELGRELDLTPLVRHAAAIAVVATNVVLTQLTDLENDTAVAALFAAGLGYATRFARTGGSAELVLCACSLGLLPGVKYYALGYAAVGAVTAIGLATARRGSKAALRLTAMGIAAGMSLSGYWYVRNWLVSGTPVFPLGISADTAVLRLVNPDTFMHSFFGSGHASLWVQYTRALWKLGGPCQAAAAVFTPATVLWLLANVLFRERRLDEGCQQGTRLAIVGALCASIVVFSFTPYTVSDRNEQKINGDFIVVRYSQCPVTLALIVLGAVLDDLGRAFARWPRRVAARVILANGPGFVAAAVAVIQLFFQCYAARLGDALLIGANLGLGTRLIREAARLRMWNNRGVIVASAGALAAVSAGSSAWLSARWHSGYAANFDYQFMTKVFSNLENGQWQAERIGAAYYRYYPFFGSRRQFRAYRPFFLATRSSLSDYVETNRIQLLAVIRKDLFKYSRYRDLGDWVRGDPAQFEMIDSAAGFDFFRVNPRRRDLSLTLAIEGDAKP